ARMNPVDREWAELELATRPPPAPAASADATLEVDLRHVPRLPDLGELEPVLEPIEPPVESSVDTVRRPSEHLAAAAAEVSVPPPTPPRSRSREMNDLVELGDYSGALEIAE